MRRNMVMAVVAVSMLSFCGFTLLMSTGFVGVTKKQRPTAFFHGCICHGDFPTPGVTVWIDGPDSLGAGQEALYRVSVVKASNIAAGFNVATYAGQLGVADSAATHLQQPDVLDSLELTHTDPKLSAGNDTISWSFYYKAPSLVGLVDTIYSVANSVDTSLDPTGDEWNFAPNFLVHIRGVTTVHEGTVEASFRLLPNFPNPFNPSTTIRFQLGEPATVRLSIHDVSGREIAELVNGPVGRGLHEVRFPDIETTGEKQATGLASGVYLYRLIGTTEGAVPRSYSLTGKMLLLK